MSLIDDAMAASSLLASAVRDALAKGVHRPTTWRLLAASAFAGLGLACATGPAPGILTKAEIMRHLERVELRDEEPALRLTKPGRRHPVYLTGRELEDGAVVVLELQF